MSAKTEGLHSCCSDCESSRAEQKWVCLFLSEEVNKSNAFLFEFPFEGYFCKKCCLIFSREFQSLPHLLFSPLKKIWLEHYLPC